MRIYVGRLLGTLASAPGSAPAPDFEIDVLRQSSSMRLAENRMTERLLAAK